MARSITRIHPHKATAALALAIVAALALSLASAAPALAKKATVGSGSEKAVYTYTTDTGKATYATCKAKGATAIVPATVTIKGASYKVVGIAPKAFAKSKATSITLKTKKLAKSRVKGALGSSKVSKVKVQVGTTPVNNQYAAKYKKWFAKANAGKKAAVGAVKVKATVKQKLAIVKAFIKARYTEWSFENGVFAMHDVDKNIAPYLADGFSRDEDELGAAPFFQRADVTYKNGLYRAEVYSLYTQAVVTQDMWESTYANATPFQTLSTVTVDKYGLVTSIVT